MWFSEFRGIDIALVAASRNDHFDDACGFRTIQYLGSVVVEVIMRKICADIDQWVWHGAHSQAAAEGGLGHRKWSIATVCARAASKDDNEP